MAFDFAKAIEKLGEAVNSGFSYVERCKEKQLETAFLDINAKQQKAIDLAEKMIIIAGKYIDSFSDTDKKEFKKLFKTFLRFN